MRTGFHHCISVSITKSKKQQLFRSCKMLPDNKPLFLGQLATRCYYTAPSFVCIAACACAVGETEKDLKFSNLAINPNMDQNLILQNSKFSCDIARLRVTSFATLKRSEN